MLVVHLAQVMLHREPPAVAVVQPEVITERDLQAAAHKPLLMVVAVAAAERAALELMALQERVALALLGALAELLAQMARLQPMAVLGQTALAAVAAVVGRLTTELLVQVAQVVLALKIATNS